MRLSRSILPFQMSRAWGSALSWEMTRNRKPHSRSTSQAREVIANAWQPPVALATRFSRKCLARGDSHGFARFHGGFCAPAWPAPATRVTHAANVSAQRNQLRSRHYVLLRASLWFTRRSPRRPIAFDVRGHDREIIDDAQRAHRVNVKRRSTARSHRLREVLADRNRSEGVVRNESHARESAPLLQLRRCGNPAASAAC